MWERRYGFPKPVRDDNGERRYSAAEVAKLRAIKRLMDVGLRPGKIIAHTLDELNALAEGRVSPRREATSPAAESEVLELLFRHDAAALQNMFANLLMRQGLQRFVLETLTSLNHAVGDAWIGETSRCRGASLHRAAASRSAHRHQRVSAAARRAEGAPHDVPRRAARPRPPRWWSCWCRKARSAFPWGRKLRSRTSGARRSRMRSTSSRCRFRARFRCVRPATGSHRCAASCRPESPSGRGRDDAPDPARPYPVCSSCRISPGRPPRSRLGVRNGTPPGRRRRLPRADRQAKASPFDARPLSGRVSADNNAKSVGWRRIDSKSPSLSESVTQWRRKKRLDALLARRALP